MRGAALTVAVLVGAMVIAGCSEEVPASPQNPGQPPDTSAAGGVPGLPHSGAPKVTTPIADASRWETDPCSVISQQQLTDAGIAIRKATPDMEAAAGVACDWATEDASLVSGGLITKSGAGLSAVYANNAQSQFDHFQPIGLIEGQPALEAMSVSTPAEGECAVDVGLRDDLIYTAYVVADDGSPMAAEPCKWAATIAGLAVQTMKQGA